MRSSHSYLIPLIIACGLFMENMDATVLTTALPTLSHDLHTNPVSLQLALTAYVVGLGVFIPVCGWVADKYGSRSVFRAAIVIFLVGSLLCSVCNSLLALVGARIVQGIGGAMMVPVGRIIIFRSVPRNEFIKAISYLTIPALFGPVIGPPLGGFITTYFHWRLIFLLNIPIGILGIALTNRFIENHHSEDPGPMDTVGLLLTSIGCTGLLLGLSLLGSELASRDVSLSLFFAGTLALFLYRKHESAAHARGATPLVNLTFLSIPTFRASVMGGSLFRIGLGALPFLLPLFLQEGFGFSAFESGMLTCFSAFGGFFMKSAAFRILHRFGFRSTLIYNAIISGFFSAVCGFFSPYTPHWLILTIILLGGCFPALQFTCLNSIAYADIPERNVAQATSLASVVQQLSLGIGVTISGITLQTYHELQGRSTVVYTDFLPSFIVIGVFAMASTLVTRRLHITAGDELARRNPFQSARTD